jgi:hypothetical protein
MAKDKEVVTEEKDKAIVGVDFMEGIAGEGYGHMTNEDYIQAFVKILQPLSPQCVKGKEEFMPDAEPGMFYNNASGQLYGTTLKVIPLYYLHEWTEWKDNRGGFVGKHEPHSVRVDTSDFTKWMTDNGNVINDTYSFYVALPDYPEAGIVLMSFTSTNIKPAKSWNSMISMVRTPGGKQAPFFSSVWELGVTKREDNNNTWYTLGKDKANAKRERYINAEEYSTVVLPLVEMARNTAIAYDKGQEETVERQVSTDY